MRKTALFAKWRAERRQKEQEAVLNCIADTVTHCFMWQLGFVLLEYQVIATALLLNEADVLDNDLKNLLAHKSMNNAERKDLEAFLKRAEEALSGAEFAPVTLTEQALPVTNGFTSEDLASLESRVLERLRESGAQSIEAVHRPNGSLWYRMIFAR